MKTNGVNLDGSFKTHVLRASSRSFFLLIMRVLFLSALIIFFYNDCFFFFFFLTHAIMLTFVRVCVSTINVTELLVFLSFQRPQLHPNNATCCVYKDVRGLLSGV
jgi:hypothetical protein